MTEQSVSAPIKHVYIPEGSQHLFDDQPAAVQVAAREILAAITAKPGIQCNTHGTGDKFEGAQKRYGRTGKRGAQQWVWYVVVDRLKTLGVIEVIAPAICGQQSKAYALTLEWSARPLVRVPDDSARKSVPRRETAKPIPRWAAANLAAAVFDMAGAVRYRLGSLGIADDIAGDLAKSLDFNAIRDAVRAHAMAKVPESERDDIVTIKCGKRSVKLTRAVHAGNAAAARFTSEFKPLWRWQIDTRDDDDTDARAWRDYSGYRLHSPITQLDSDLRQFLSFGGLDTADTGLVQIDAVNAQAVFLAALIARELPDSDDARRFLDTCGRGRFYEETFAAVHGREPSRSTAPDKRVKYRKPRKTPDPETGRMHTVVWGSERDAWKRRMMGAWLYAEADTQIVTKEGRAIGGVRADDEDDSDEDNQGSAEFIGGLWPDVHTFMLGRKLSLVTHDDGTWRKEGARALPIAMQRAESSLWIDAIVPALERAGVPVWTIHDSAIVPAHRADEALAVIRAAYVDAGYVATFGPPETIR